MNRQTAKLLKSLSQMLFKLADSIERERKPIVYGVVTFIAAAMFLAATLM